MSRKTYTLYFGNGKTQDIQTSNPEKAKRIFNAKSYVEKGELKR